MRASEQIKKSLASLLANKQQGAQEKNRSPSPQHLHDAEELTQKDALQMANDWALQRHANVFDILRQKNMTRVDEDSAGMDVYFSPCQPNTGGKDQLNRLEGNGWFDDNIINWYMHYLCRQNQDTMEYAPALRRIKALKNTGGFKNTRKVDMLVLSCTVSARVMMDATVNEIKHLDWGLFNKILMPVNPSVNISNTRSHWILVLIDLATGSVRPIDPLRNDTRHTLVRDNRKEYDELQHVLNKLINRLSGIMMQQHAAPRDGRVPGNQWHIASFDYGDQKRQVDGVNCGIFACVNASCIALGRRLPALTKGDFRTFRTWLANIMYESGQAHEQAKVLNAQKADDETDDDDELRQIFFRYYPLRGATPPPDTCDLEVGLPHLLTLVVYDPEDRDNPFSVEMAYTATFQEVLELLIPTSLVGRLHGQCKPTPRSRQMLWLKHFPTKGSTSPSSKWVPVDEEVWQDLKDASKSDNYDYAQVQNQEYLMLTPAEASDALRALQSCCEALCQSRSRDQETQELLSLAMQSFYEVRALL